PRTCWGCEGTGLHASSRRRRHSLAQGFQGRQSRPLFLSAGRHARLYQGGDSFSQLRANFAKTGTAILGVSADPVAAQDKFKSKHKLTFALGSDGSKKMLASYGAWGEKSMYGRKYMGVIRKTVLIDAVDRIARIWPKVSVPGHAEAVLAAAREL